MVKQPILIHGRPLFYSNLSGFSSVHRKEKNMIILKDIMHTEPLPHDFTCESHLCTAHYNYTFPGSIFCGFQRCGPVAKHCASPPFRFHPRARTNPCVLAHTRAAPPGGRQIFSASGKFGGLPRPAPTVRCGGSSRRRRQPAAARRLLLRGFLGVKAPGSSTRNYCWASPTRGEGPGNGSVLRTIGPATPPRAAGLLSAMHGSQPPGWETRYRSLCRLGGFLF